MELAREKRQGLHCVTAEIGPLSELGRYVYSLPGTSLAVEGKVFLGPLLGLTGAEISINRMLPGQGMPFLHRHKQNEEVFIFIGGEGEFRVDGNVFPVREGSVVRVARDGERCWRNTGSSELIYIVVQSREGSYEGHTTMDGIPVRRPVSW
jgi:mannose-6-phosphate isomerase-like protein (cupin superfamily)